VFDVGIAEQHAATSAAGLAFGGLHPVVAVYATFINRAFDQVLMDVALHKAGVTFVLDRAGVTGPDGPSHHGVWDLSILQVVPGIRIAAPARLRPTGRGARRGRGRRRRSHGDPLPEGHRRRRLRRDPAHRRRRRRARRVGRRDVLLVTVGPMAGIGLQVAERLEAQGIGATVVDPRWVVPVPASVIGLARDHRIVVSIEDGIRVGGIGTRIRQDLREADVDTAVTEIGLPDEFLEHGRAATSSSASGSRRSTSRAT
jgi:1-deoxy-D-xylulose-5-phosphate synthase